jgi:RNA polymerase sigma-70 factor (ECF subfamily)
MRLFQKDYSTRPDEELMSLLAKGGQQAFDELYSRYSKRMLNFFFRMLNCDREKAEDMLHDLFLKIIEKPESFDSTRTFSTWFYMLAGNMVRNEYRSLHTRNEYEQHRRNQPETGMDFTGEDMDKQLFHRQLQAELNDLNPEARILFNLRFVEEMSVKKIAEILECPEGTVKSRLFNMTRQLSKKLRIYKPTFN